jgi:hypothetical protein
MQQKEKQTEKKKTRATKVCSWEENQIPLSSSHMHASLSLASLQQLLYQYHVSQSSTGEAQTHDQYEASRGLLLHHNSTEFLSFWLPNLLQPGSL